MDTTIINIKTSPKLKKEAQKIVSGLGLTLSSAINGFLKQLILNKEMLFTLDESKPSKYLLDAIKESKQDRKNNNYYAFNNNKEAIEFLAEQ